MKCGPPQKLQETVDPEAARLLKVFEALLIVSMIVFENSARRALRLLVLIIKESTAGVEAFKAFKTLEDEELASDN